MNSKQVTWGKEDRITLHEILPLNTPFALVVGASSICNFKCNYCIHSLSKLKLKSINFSLSIMEYELFKKLVNDAKSFQNHIKVLQFLKDGEQLLNKKLPEMIKYAKMSNVFDKIELITNGSLLNPKLNLELINSGLDTLRISLQGINEERYNEISNVNINFENFIDNIKHFYNNRKINNKNCKLHLKMIDIGIDNEKDMEIFKDICDEFSIQYTIPYFTDVNYNNIKREKESKREFDKDLFGNDDKKIKVCSRPFMSIYVSADGNVMPCCRENIKSMILGNINNESIYDIWNGKTLKNIRLIQLKNERFSHETCKNCCIPNKITVESDNLDNYTEKLLKCYE